MLEDNFPKTTSLCGLLKKEDSALWHFEMPFAVIVIKKSYYADTLQKPSCREFSLKKIFNYSADGSF